MTEPIITSETPWYEKNFDRATALEFLSQLRTYTLEFIVNREPHLASIMPTADLGAMHLQPNGAIIHPSHSKYLWSSIKAALQPNCTQHFIIARKRHERVNYIGHYPLVQALPTTVLMPHPPTELIQHSGWVSKRTVGIELCNCDMLRASRSFIVEPSDYDPVRFAMNDGIDQNSYKFFWAGNAWREEFDGDVYIHGLHAYELPSMPQLESLAVVLRALDEAYDIDPSLVLPCSCVGETPTVLPHLNFDELRIAMKYRSAVDVGVFGAAANQDNTYMDEDDIIDEDIEGLTAMEAGRNRWRSDTDDGHFSILKRMVNYKYNCIDDETEAYLQQCGYHTEDVNTAMTLWALSHTTTAINGFDETDIAQRMIRTLR